MNAKPLVSIIIPVYNGSNYLAKAIDSALAQTYENVEVLVINDGSTDGGATRKVALSYGDRIRYLEKENGGVATALNIGIENMRGEYFSWLSHDDEYYPTKVQKEVEFLYQYGLKNTLLFSDFAVIDRNSVVVDIVRCYNKTLRPFDAIAFGLINGCTMLIPRACFETMGFFDHNLPNTQDYAMWFRLIAKYPIKLLPEVLVKSRQHGQQQSKIDSSYGIECNNFYITFINYLAHNHSEYVSESVFFFQLQAFLRKTRYMMAANYVQNHYLRNNWFNKLRILYYQYINTNWGSSVGLCTMFTDPRRFINKVVLKIKNLFLANNLDKV